MTTTTLSGFALTNSDAEVPTFAGNVTIDLVFAEGTTATYSVVSGGFVNSLGVPEIDFVFSDSFTTSEGPTPGDEAYMMELSLSSGGSLIVLSIYDEQADTDYVFIFDAPVGVSIPTNQSEFNAIFGSITSASLPGGSFAPGVPLSLADIPAGTVSENDSFTGTDQADSFNGGAGSDTIQGLDGSDTLIGGDGDDFIFGGSTENDLRDVVYAGNGNDSVDGGYGNDELRGDAGNDTLIGGYGADTVIGGDDDDVLTAQAWGDVLYGGAGDDFINGGFGYDRANGGTGADRFYHVGVEGHGSDWIQDYSSTEGDLLVFGGTGATVSQFQINTVETESAGQAGVEESFVIYRPTGQILWALVDGSAQSQINIVIGGTQYDLLA